GAGEAATPPRRKGSWVSEASTRERKARRRAVTRAAIVLDAGGGTSKPRINSPGNRPGILAQEKGTILKREGRGIIGYTVNIYINYIITEGRRMAKTEAARNRGAREGNGRKLLRSFTATAREIEMLEAISAYHGFSKSATLTSLIRKEFWRIFPRGTRTIRPDPGARVVE